MILPPLICQAIKQKLINLGPFRKKILLSATFVNPQASQGILPVKAPNIKQRSGSQLSANELIGCDPLVSYSLSLGKLNIIQHPQLFNWRFTSCQAETDCKLHPNGTNNIHWHQQLLGAMQLPVPDLRKCFSSNQEVWGTATGRLFPSGDSEHCLPVLSMEGAQQHSWSSLTVQSMA